MKVPLPIILRYNTIICQIRLPMMFRRLLIAGLSAIVCGCAQQAQQNEPAEYYQPDPYTQPCSNCHDDGESTRFQQQNYPLDYHAQFAKLKTLAAIRMRLIDPKSINND